MTVQERPVQSLKTAMPVAPMDAASSATASDLQKNVRRYVQYMLGKQWKYATAEDLFKAVSWAVRERVIDTHLHNETEYREHDRKSLYYLSMEFLMGRCLGNNLINLGIYDLVSRALEEMEVDLEAVEESERDAALGNGGLGRLAACFLDSLATLGLPAYGYGINYDFGLFRQSVEDGYQREMPDSWRVSGCPWLVDRPSATTHVPLYGRVANAPDQGGGFQQLWVDRSSVIGVAQDMPVIGFGGHTVNYLRLFSARTSDNFDVEIFNTGDYVRAVEDKISAERISKILYPSDDVSAGRELRLIQEYFLVTCSLQDILRRFGVSSSGLELLADKVAVQLNDTHPALSVAELMRLLIDENGLPWDRAWSLCRRTLAYTNHTLLPEALEKWPVPLMEKVLPRHLQIIYEVNRRFLERISIIWPEQPSRLERMSIIEESEPKQVRMAHLAIVGSHSTNGVAKLHSQLLRTKVFPDFDELYPEAFHNKTNGVTQRRWLLYANPMLSRLISKTIGEGWITQLEELRQLEPLLHDAAFCEEFRQAKRWNKERLARVIHDTLEVSVDPDSLFDIQAKRIHLYKRQLLHLLYVVHEYLDLLDGKQLAVPRTHVFAGKAAPGYRAAKEVIKLVHNVADLVNHDPRCRNSLRVAFLADYRVSLAEKIIPAADLSEQISTAGKEASGTGNMKFAMNGALTMGTLDGANIEILEQVGADNMFVFGLRAEEVEALHRERSFHPTQICEQDPRVGRVMGALRSGLLRRSGAQVVQSIHDLLMNEGDEFLHLADLGSYLDAQEQAAQIYKDPHDWARRAILNVARIGIFSSDRTVLEYARDTWGLIDLGEPAATP